MYSARKYRGVPQRAEKVVPNSSYVFCTAKYRGGAPQTETKGFLFYASCKCQGVTFKLSPCVLHKGRGAPQARGLRKTEPERFSTPPSLRDTSPIFSLRRTQRRNLMYSLSASFFIPFFIPSLRDTSPIFSSRRTQRRSFNVFPVSLLFHSFFHPLAAWPSPLLPMRHRGET